MIKYIKISLIIFAFIIIGLFFKENALGIKQNPHFMVAYTLAGINNIFERNFYEYLTSFHNKIREINVENEPMESKEIKRYTGAAAIERLEQKYIDAYNNQVNEEYKRIKKQSEEINFHFYQTVKKLETPIVTVLGSELIHEKLYSKKTILVAQKERIQKLNNLLGEFLDFVLKVHGFMGNYIDAYYLILDKEKINSIFNSLVAQLNSLSKAFDQAIYLNSVSPFTKLSFKKATRELLKEKKQAYEKFINMPDLQAELTLGPVEFKKYEQAQFNKHVLPENCFILSGEPGI